MTQHRRPFGMKSITQLGATLQKHNAEDRIIGGVVDHKEHHLWVVKGDMSSCFVPFTAFKPGPNGIVPDFNNVYIDDYGRILVLGHYEMGSDEVIDNSVNTLIREKQNV